MHGEELGGNGPRLQRAAGKSIVIMAFMGLILALSAPMAFADCSLTDPSCNLDQTTQTATDTANSAKDQADGAVKNATDAVNGILNPVVPPTPTPTPTGRGGGDGGHRGGGSSVRNGGPARTPISSGVGAINRDAITGAATPALPSSRPLGQRTSHGPSLFSRIGGAAAEAGRQVALPLALALAVVAFLMAQNRLDRRDPKLATAPIAPDVLRFD